MRVGIAGWANPPSQRIHRGGGRSHLSYYSQHFSCVEVNSSFYKPHLSKTYVRWRDETPAQFLFSVKMPRSITHEAGLRHARGEVLRFYEEISHLQPKLAVVLIQLPPSLEYFGSVARTFFSHLPALRGVKIACEPRHSSWFTPSAEDALRRAHVSRVAADPAGHIQSGSPGGDPNCAYFRWHGSPHTYYSKYAGAQLEKFLLLARNSAAKKAWCIFDNTARYASWENALVFQKMLSIK